MDIIKFAINNPVKVFVAILFVILFGVQALMNMSYQLIPNIDYPQITVRTGWSGASPYEMEKEVVDRQERVLKTIPGLIDFESTASNGSASVTLMFGLDTNVNDAMLLVSNKLNEVRGYPDDVTLPTIRASNTDSIAVIDLMLVTLDDNPISINEYGSYFEEVIKPYLERVKGVSDLSYWGGRAKQIQIKIDPNLMSVYNISITSVVSALTQENVNISAGTLDFGDKDYRFRTLGEVKSPNDIKEIVILANDNSRVKLGDIAEIDYGFSKPNTIVRLGETDALKVGIIAQSGANVLELTDGVEAVVNKLNDGILKDNGLRFEWISDQRGYINRAIALVKSNIVFGGILAVLVLLLFLRSVRSTLVIATTIPISIVGTFFMMSLLGRSLNVISLAGIAFSVGMLIDSGIVVLENIDRHLNEGKSAFKAAYFGAKEVWGAILASTLTTVAVFLPVVFIKEEAGKLFSDIALAVSSAVMFSLIVSILVIPVLTKLMYSKKPKGNQDRKIDLFLLKWGGMVSNGIMALSMRINSSVFLRLVTVLVLTVISLGSAYLLMPKMDYLPLGNKNMVESYMTVAPGLSYKERLTIGEDLYAKLKPYIGNEKDNYPAIKTMYYIGGGTMVSMAVTSADEDRAAELQPLLNKVLATVPGTSASTSQSPLFNIGRGSGNVFRLNVGGNMEYETLIEVVNLLQQRVMQRLPEAQVRIMPSATPMYPEVQFIPNREALKAVGISSQELGVALDTYLDGRKVGEFKDDTIGTIDIMLQGQDTEKHSPQEVYSTLINAKNGFPVPMSSLSEMKEIMGVDRIRRYNSQRSFVLLASIQTGMVLEELRNIIMNEVIVEMKNEGLLDGVEFTISGASSKLQDAKAALQGNFLLAIIITYLLMVALFDNFIYPLIILFTLPLAASGGFVGLALVNLFIAPQPLDVLTMLGFIMLVGIVVNNAILIVHQAINNVRYGMNKVEAINESLRTRIRPIFMSALTSLFGMLPLVVAPGAGSELYRGLGSVILGGLAISTLFTIFVIPALLSFFLPNKLAEKED